MDIKITKEGYKLKEEELQNLLEEQKRILLEIQRTVKMGDLKENSGYAAAKEQQSVNEGKILEVRYILKKAEIIEKTNDGTIQMGSKIQVEVNGLDREFEIVGPNEEVSANRLSIKSPVGSRLLGAKQGEEVKIKIPAGEVTYKVKKVF